MASELQPLCPSQGDAAMLVTRDDQRAKTEAAATFDDFANG